MDIIVYLLVILGQTVCTVMAVVQNHFIQDFPKIYSCLRAGKITYLTSDQTVMRL